MVTWPELMSAQNADHNMMLTQKAQHSSVFFFYLFCFLLTLAMSSGVCPMASNISIEDGK